MQISIRDIVIGIVIALVIISLPSIYYFGMNLPKERNNYQAEISKLKSDNQSLRNQLDSQKDNQAVKDYVVSDIVSVSDKYTQLYNLCEEKYQEGLSGNINYALQVKGKMSQIEDDISNIMEKYNSKNNVKSNSL